MVEPQLPKLMTWVRIPSPAPSSPGCNPLTCFTPYSGHIVNTLSGANGLAGEGGRYRSLRALRRGAADHRQHRGPRRHREDPRPHRAPRCRRLAPRSARAAGFLERRFALAPDTSASGRAVGRHRHDLVRSPPPNRWTFSLFWPEMLPRRRPLISAINRAPVLQTHFDWLSVLAVSSSSFLSAGALILRGVWSGQAGSVRGPTFGSSASARRAISFSAPRTSGPYKGRWAYQYNRPQKPAGCQ